jgi:RNA polymerase sigma-70 factor (ECF subfamily)
MARTVPSPQLTSDTHSASDFQSELLRLAPYLRAFAWSLCGNREDADDLAQETLIKAWQARDTFIPGTNLKAWLFTIQRNQFYTNRRTRGRQVAWNQQAAETLCGTSQEPMWAAELSDTARALACLPDEQREVLILVGAGGFSCEETAEICHCAVGTVKSRATRARRALLKLLDGENDLRSAARPEKGGAADEILAQLDRLSPSANKDAAAKRRNKSPRT